MTSPPQDDAVANEVFAADRDGPAHAATPKGRRRNIILALIALVLVVTAGVLAFVPREREPFEVQSPDAGANPTAPTADPIELDTSTALASALPASVLQFAASAEQPSELMAGLHALEGWQVTYSAAAGDLVLDVGQWPDEVEATAALAALRAQNAGQAEGEPVEVLVGDAVVGDVITEALADGTERTSWRNATVVLSVVGPAGTTAQFFDVFPL